MFSFTEKSEYNPALASHWQEIQSAFRDLLSSEHDGPLFIYRRDGETHRLTRLRFRHAIIALKDLLIEKGYQVGERLAIFSESCPEWPLAFLGGMQAGLTVVPVDARSTEAEIAHILAHSGVSVAFVSQALRPKIEKLRTELPALKEIVTIDDAASGLLALADGGGEHRFPPRGMPLESTAVIAYTSGTLGAPKGVMVPASALWFEVISLQRIFQSKREDVLLSMLPLNHMFELTCGLFAAMFTGARIVFANSLLPNELMELMQEHGVTRMITVPLFLEHVQRAIVREVSRQSKSAQRAFALMQRLARVLPFPWRRKLFAKVHAKFGGGLKLFIVGGAPLRKEVGEFFERLGIRVRQGYGLTETAPVITVNRPRANRMGSVGLPLDLVGVKIVPEKPGEKQGEILVRGPMLMKGYYRNEEYTREVLDEQGWFHTGDIGMLDRKGFLWITGRKKNMIVLPGGKKVWPEEVEEALALNPLVQEICVLGIRSIDVTGADGERVVAVIRAESGVDARKLEEALRPQILTLAPFKRPSRFVVYPHEFPKTATRKVKRLALLEELKKEKYL